jgi:hypothetical protein
MSVEISPDWIVKFLADRGPEKLLAYAQYSQFFNFLVTFLIAPILMLFCVYLAVKTAKFLFSEIDYRLKIFAFVGFSLLAFAVYRQIENHFLSIELYRYDYNAALMVYPFLIIVWKFYRGFVKVIYFAVRYEIS